MKAFWNSIKDYIYIVVIVLLIRTFIVTPAIVDGSSMDYTLEDGQLVLVNKFIYRFSDIKRNDIVVLNNKVDKDKIIKRIIALPGETVQIINGYVYVNDKKLDDVIKEESFAGLAEDKIILEKDEYFVLGDNRNVSKDSRLLGKFKSKDILGRVSIRLFPFNKIGKIKL